MRRLILVFFMVLLPLQWSWAAAARVCGHEAQESRESHFGHHQHEHAAEDGADHPGAGEGGLSAPAMGEHPDCQGCHGLGTFCMASPVQGWLLSPESAPPGDRGGPFAMPPVYGLLRPPQTT